MGQVSQYLTLRDVDEMPISDFEVYNEWMEAVRHFGYTIALANARPRIALLLSMTPERVQGFLEKFDLEHNPPHCQHCHALKELATGMCGKCFRFPTGSEETEEMELTNEQPQL